MLNKNKNLKVSYLSRLLVLPLAALLFFAFTLKMKTIGSVNHYAGKKITVIIDAGHGGEDGGAQSENGIYEKTLALSIARKVKELNNNKNLNIVLTRDKDKTIGVKQRVDFAKSLSANLFISIHIGAEINSSLNSSLVILIAQNGNRYLRESKVLGTALLESFKNNYQLQVANNLKQSDKRVWVLEANECPSVLVEAGFLTNKKDIAYLLKLQNQATIARSILNGIEKYAQENLSGQSIKISDTIPATEIQTGAMFIDANNKVFLKVDTIIHTTEPNKTNVNVNKAVIVIDGKIENNSILKEKTIVAKKLTIHSGDDQKILSKYGASAKNGVFDFEDAVIIDKPAYYPDESSINKYDSKENEGVKEIENEKRLTYINDSIPQFYKGKKIKEAHGSNKLNKTLIVYEDGSTDTISIKEGEKIRIIPPPPPPPNNVSKEIIINDEKLNQTKADLITKPDKIFTIVETEAQFPGGQEAWLKYIQSVIQKNADILLKDDNQGTCIVQFIVDANGNIRDVKPTTMENSKLAEVAVNAIKKGPQWKPAIQNGHIVTSYKKQPVTFKINDNIVGTEPQ